MMPDPNWEGAGGNEHRTVGPHRAWCYDDHEWCYPDDWCDCCHRAHGHVMVWITEDDVAEGGE